VPDNEQDFVTIEVPAFAGEAYRQGPDGKFVKMTDEERAVAYAESEVRHAARVKAKGHDCNDHVVHELFESSRGGMQDSYVCGLCGDLLQVG
jgi:hypothetical protein